MTNIDFTLAALVFFFSFFLGVLWWVYRPAQKQKLDRYAHIPLSEDSHG